ncbi:MAG: hypothetical protein Q8O38_02410 [Sulfurimicrobium sp.]|nr:hypothetical protein [Sulfurimicrobium sp.]
MNVDKLLLLQEELRGLENAATHLRFSINRTQNLLNQQDWQPEELERLESLASRFARLSDLLMQRVMRLIDDLELTATGTLLDRIHRAEKRGWVDDAIKLVRIRELRNLIAHEYAADKMAEIYTAVVALAPELLAVVPKVTAYAHELEKKYPVR